MNNIKQKQVPINEILLIRMLLEFIKIKNNIEARLINEMVKILQVNVEKDNRIFVLIAVIKKFSFEFTLSIVLEVAIARLILISSSVGFDLLANS